MALEALQQGKDLTGVDFYLCPVCGNIEMGKAPDTCPICGTKGEKFIKM
jgi:rubrerythrin